MAIASPGTVSKTGNPYLDALVGENRWDLSDGPITFAFGDRKAEDVEVVTWTRQAEIAVHAAVTAWSSVANLQFRQLSDNADADIQLYTVDGLAEGTLGAAWGPDGRPTDGRVLFDVLNSDDWLRDLPVGGYSYYVVLHELGHALGLQHPHDTRRGSDFFPGVDSPGDPGEHGLATGLNTVMAYITHKEKWSPDKQQAYGYMLGPMAFDIAAIQAMYGANTEFAKGDNPYDLPTANQTYTGYSCIWDAGGTDTIRNGSARDSVIDLRAAPLTGKNAGGYLSSVEGVFGGFTIANGVEIEKAIGGGGSDRLIGNAIGNELRGNGARDFLYGREGADLLYAGSGRDVLDGGSGRDSVFGGSGNDWIVATGGGDEIWGGLGADRFELVKSPQGGPSVIKDFLWGQGDKIAVQHEDFGLPAPAEGKSYALPTSMFYQGTGSPSPTGIFLFDAARQVLSWDPDGFMPQSPIELVKFGGNVSLWSSDILVF